MRNDGWQTIPLGSILAEPIRNGISPVESQVWTGVEMLGLGCLTPNGFQPRQLKHAPSAVFGQHSAVLTDGDLLVSRANTRILVGMAGIYRDIGVPCIYPDLMMRLRTSGRYIPEFLEIVLRAPEARRCIAALAQGTSDSMVKISADVINRMEIPDVPISDQQRFVAGLDAVSTLERGLCSGILKIRNVRSGLLGREFSEGVGGGWPLKEIGNLCEVSSGATPSRAAGSRYFSSSGMPWVKTLDLNEGLISATDETLTEAAISELRMRQFPERSVLVAMYGGWEQIGRTAILGVPAAVNQAIAVLQPLGGLNPDYLLLAMQHMRHQWRRFAASTRKDPNVTKSDVLGFRIPVPPYGDQVRIVQLAAASLQDITAAEQQLNGLRKLKEGLTSELISGQRSFVGGLSK